MNQMKRVFTKLFCLFLSTGAGAQVLEVQCPLYSYAHGRITETITLKTQLIAGVQPAVWVNGNKFINDVTYENGRPIKGAYVQAGRDIMQVGAFEIPRKENHWRDDGFELLYVRASNELDFYKTLGNNVRIQTHHSNCKPLVERETWDDPNKPAKPANSAKPATASSAPVKSEAKPAPLKTPLTDRADVQNGKCRGGHGDNPSTWKACERRDEIIEQLKKQNICWGTLVKNAPNSDANWYACNFVK